MKYKFVYYVFHDNQIDIILLNKINRPEPRTKIS
jgi:hypothetical protein